MMKSLCGSPKTRLSPGILINLTHVLSQEQNTAILVFKMFDWSSEDCDAVFPQARPIRCRHCHFCGRAGVPLRSKRFNIPSRGVKHGMVEGGLRVESRVRTHSSYSAMIEQDYLVRPHERTDSMGNNDKRSVCEKLSKRREHRALRQNIESRGCFVQNIRCRVPQKRPG